MQHQIDLLSDSPVARHNDPATSHVAAGKVRNQRASQQQRILEGCRKFPNHTSFELAAALRMDRYVVARRLPELRNANLVRNGEARTCNVSGNRAMTWRVV